MTLNKRTLIWIAVAAGLVAAVTYSMRPMPLDVEAAEAVKGPLAVTVAEEGETRLARRFVVSASVPGRVLRIDLRPGDPVTAGAALATLQPGDPALLDIRTRAGLEARVKTADAALSRARADSERARIEYERLVGELKRQQQLLAADLIARDVVEAIEARMRAGEEGMRAAQFAVRAAEFDVEQARAGLLQGRGGGGGGRPVVVPAPISGVVLKRLQESESVVAAGTPLVEIGDLRDLEIVSDLLSTDAVRVKAGARVLVDRWGGDQPLEGRVRRVEPSGFTKISALGVEEQRVNVIVDFADPPEKRPSLGDGYRVEVRIVTAERTDVLKVPTSAIFRRGDQWAAFVVAGDVASMRPIAIGLRSETEVEVSSGLSAGDRVILYPPEGLAEGALVRAATPSARPR